ncbi:hypothetical protein KEM54_002036 [Ascosphaera aggregata]|nr:hypothetical protein KEM54_002036 [Ascosphaera aggregata]
MDSNRPSPVIAPHLQSQSQSQSHPLSRPQPHPHPHPQGSAMSTPAKRKYDAAPPSSLVSSAAEPLHANLNTNPALRETLSVHLRALLSLLQKYDNDVDVLKTPIPPHDEPDPKRPRIGHEQPEVQQNIESRVLSDSYDSLQSFISDLDAASIIVTDRRRTLDKAGAPLPPGTPSLQDVINRTRILRKHVDNYVSRSPLRDNFIVKSTFPSGSAAAAPAASVTPVAPAAPSPIPSATESSQCSEVRPFEELHAREGTTVLTIYGNAPRGKQLFSSLRKSSEGKQAGKITEEDLPPGISISQVIPFNPGIDQAEHAKTRTFAEVFPPKTGLPPLDPPPYPPVRPAVVPWVDRYEAAVNACIRPEESTGYLYYPIPSGRWIQYGYENVVRNTLKKSQTQVTPLQAATRGNRLRRGPFGHHTREDDPLFANAYSSFAPSYESAGALVGREVRERMWWETFGMGKMVEAIQLGQETEAGNGKRSEKKEEGVGLEVIDDALLQEAVDAYQEDSKTLLQQESKDHTFDKDLDEVLESISDLIQTLNSYRQLRNLYPPRPANAGGQISASISTSAQLSSSVVSATPSAEELMTYETLKSSLAAMVATLPPYALAKFTSDQLEELHISKSILVKGPDHPGTMEEDEYTLQQRHYRLSQPTPQPASAVSATMPTPASGRGSSRASMAYQATASAPIAGTAAPITYQRSYASSGRMMKTVPSSNAAAVPYQAGVTPPGYSAVRPHSQRSTHGHTQSPYAPTVAGAPVYAAQPSAAYQARGASAAGMPTVSPVNGAVPFNPPQQVLSPAMTTLPTQGQPLSMQQQSTAAYYAQTSPVPPYQLNPTGQMPLVSATAAAPGGPMVPTSSYVTSSSSRSQVVPNMSSTPVTTPVAANVQQQPRYYAQQAPKPIPRSSSLSMAQGYTQSPMIASPVPAAQLPAQNVQYTTKPAMASPQVSQMNGRASAPGTAGSGR